MKRRNGTKATCVPYASDKWRNPITSIEAGEKAWIYLQNLQNTSKHIKTQKAANILCKMKQANQESRNMQKIAQKFKKN